LDSEGPADNLQNDRKHWIQATIMDDNRPKRVDEAAKLYLELMKKCLTDSLDFEVQMKVEVATVLRVTKGKFCNIHFQAPKSLKTGPDKSVILLVSFCLETLNLRKIDA
jgi:hypothetical protein